MYSTEPRFEMMIDHAIITYDEDNMTHMEIQEKKLLEEILSFVNEFHKENREKIKKIKKLRSKADRLQEEVKNSCFKNLELEISV